MRDEQSGFAAAKINLSLHVVGQQANGYHELDSLVVFAQIGDQVRVKIGEQDEFSITGPFANEISADANNLVLRARNAFRETFLQIEHSPLSIELEKNLPIAAGIGGGSADAATILNLMTELAQFSGHDVDASRVFKVASNLGADVPMCLDLNPKHITGVGETFSTVPPVPKCYALLINPRVPVSTPDVFRALESRNNTPMPDMNGGWNSFEDLCRYLRETRNDMAAAAISLVPEIAVLIEATFTLPHCQFAQMSGSGATVFGLFETKSQAQSAVQKARAIFPKYWIEFGEVCH